MVRVVEQEPVWDSAAKPAQPQAAEAVVIIPCLNERPHLPGLIQGLLADPDWRDPLIVVADGGSTDGSREFVAAITAADLRVQLMNNPGRIQSAGVNRAAKLYGKERRWLIRVDAHAHYPPSYVSTLIAEAKRTGAESVVVAMASAGRTCFQKAAAAAQNSMLGAGGSAHRRDGAAGYVDHGHHALMDLRTYRDIGGYDERFGHNEDAEYDIRLANSGGRIWLTRRTRVTYYPRTTVFSLFRQYLSYGDGRAKTCLKHGLWPRPRQLAPLAVAPTVLIAPFGLVFGPAMLAPAALWAGASIAFGVALGIRQKSSCAMASGLAAMVMHLGWSIGFWVRLARGLQHDPMRVDAETAAQTANS